MPTVKGYLPEWLETYAKVHCKPSTYRGYKRAIEQHLIPTFRNRPLHLLKRDEVKRFITTQIEAVKARGTIQNYLVRLKAAFNQAKEDGLVVLNPAERLGKLLQRSQDRPEEMLPLTAQEV